MISIGPMGVSLRHSLRTKLAVVIAIQSVLVCVLLIAYFPSQMESISRKRIDQQAVSLATVVASSVAPGIEYDDKVYVEDILKGFGEAHEVTYAAVRRPDGSLLAAWKKDAVPELDVEPGSEPELVERGGDLHVVTQVTSSTGQKGSLSMGFSLAALERERESNMLIVGGISAIVMLVGLVFAVLVGTYFVRPLGRMTAVAQRAATGDLSQPEDLAAGKDEVGQMAAAFDEMIRSQKAMVRQIAETATDLASAATQIRAAAQEQEAGTGEQQAAVEEVDRTMQSLLEAAAHIAESARGVLDNAEQTRQTTDQTAQRIEELSGHTQRIAEILEVIRDIADRSDLLALNASLEATRAGEAGRSFSLVAAEMRRLAERVTASVQDVRNLVDDIRASSGSTVDSTEQSRSLAENTTESAREITTVTQQQRSATEQASQSMSQVSDALTQSASATQETRRLSEDLKRLADRLSELVGQFKTG